MIGLTIGLLEWEYLYPKRGDEKEEQDNIFGESIIAVTSVFGALAIIIKYRMEATWRHYDNPMKFYRKIMR